MKVSRRVVKSSFITLGVVILITLLIVFLNTDINKRRKKIEATHSQNKLFRLSIEEFGNLKADRDLADKAFKVVDSALPDRDELATFPREVEQMGEKYSLGLGFAFGVETLEGESEVGSIIYDLTASGPFDNLLLFLKEFEAHPYYISMRSFNIAKSISEDPTLVGEDIFVLKTQGEIFTK